MIANLFPKSLLVPSKGIPETQKQELLEAV